MLLCFMKSKLNYILFKSKKDYVLIVTGIYLPEIGGPAIFVEAITKYFKTINKAVKIITLAKINKPFLIEDNLIRIKKDLPKLLRTVLLIYFIHKNSKKSTHNANFILKSILA